MTKPQSNGPGRLISATRFSLAGLRAAFQGEAAFRFEVLLVGLLAPVALVLDVSRAERALLLALLLLLLIVELLNSAVEAAFDQQGTDHNPFTERGKDMGSAAVFLTFIANGLAWGLILFS